MTKDNIVLLASLLLMLVMPISIVVIPSKVK